MALLGAAFSPSAKADDFNNRTVVTFSGPVEIPGVHLQGWAVLPAGTYVFKVMNSPSNRHIVQILNQAEDHVYTTILAIPDYRMRATGKTVMTFKERAEGQPEAIRSWFYPGREWGDQFVYPKSRAVELAKIVNEPVLATPVELPAPVETLKTAPIIAVKPTGEEVEVTEVIQTPPAEVAAVETPAPVAALPQTASPLPLVGLIGLLSLGAGLTLWSFSKRAA